MTLFKTLLIPACLAVLLSGCATTQAPSKTDAPGAESVAGAAPLPAADLEPETLYTLLVAELAGQRKRYDILLSNYLSAARETRDPGLAERATRIAASIKARKATFMAAQLWHEVAPDNPEAKQVLAAQLLLNGQVHEAVGLMEELLQETGEASFDHLAASSRQLTPIQRDDLLIELERLLGKYPDNTQLLTAKIVLLQLNGRNEEALLSANELDRQQNSVRSLSIKAKLNHQLGNTEQALKDLKKGLKKHPDDQVLRVLYAQMLIDDKQLRAAQTQFEQLVKQSPENDQLRLTLALLQLENSAFRKGNDNLKMLLKNPALKDEVQFYLGQSAEKAGQPETAIDHYRLVSAGSKFLPAYHRLGTLSLEQGNLARLQTLFAQARQSHVEHSKSLYIIEAELLAEKNLVDNALQLLNQALEQHPDDINLLYTRAMTSEKINDLAAMEMDLRAILSQEPDNAMVLNALGYTLADRTTRYEEALALISRANELKPNDPAITDSLGWAQFRMGNYEEAIRLLERAHADFPDHEVAAHLGEALWTNGQQQRARQIWQEALERQPDSPILKRVIERLSPDLNQ
ncbi:MAG: tetratricopeptide repeat protein [Pseudomonadales bacterium]